MAGIGGGMEGPLGTIAGGVSLTVKGICVWLGCVLVFIGGIIALLTNDEVNEVIIRASALEAEAQKHLDDRTSLLKRLEELSKLDVKRLALIDANRSMREALENALLIERADVSGSVSAMLDAARRFILTSIGFGIEEQWAISVFQVQGDKLVRIAAMRAGQLPPPEEARSWGRHQGFVGEAWARSREMIIDDTSAAGTLEAYPVPPELQRPYDAERYRSMAAIPVRLGAEEIWGVVAASTDCVERFRRDPLNRQVQSVDTIRLITRMTGLAAAAFRRSGQ